MLLVCRESSLKNWRCSAMADTNFLLLLLNEVTVISMTRSSIDAKSDEVVLY
jgi:hypothetical protein